MKIKREKSLRDIYTLHFKSLWAFVYSRLRQKEVAEDIVADSFVALSVNFENIKDKNAIKSYLFRICINKMNQHYAREKTVNVSPAYLDHVAGVNSHRQSEDRKPQEERDNFDRELQSLKTVESILDQLPEKYEKVLRLRFLSGLKLKEVAEILDITVNNVKVIQHRALKKAKELNLSN
jgi:RNA polymerase sigma-70 factor (ECF subfamily)